MTNDNSNVAEEGTCSVSPLLVGAHDYFAIISDKCVPVMGQL